MSSSASSTTLPVVRVSGTTAGDSSRPQAKAAPLPGAATPTTAPEPRQALRETLEAVAQNLEDYLRRSGRNLSFRVDESAGATVITVRDSDTGEVIRQMPSEEALRIQRSLHARSATLLDRTV
jgi:flagellar protein FlaG